jgi:hypothetical protein
MGCASRGLDRPSFWPVGYCAGCPLRHEPAKPFTFCLGIPFVGFETLSRTKLIAMIDMADKPESATALETSSHICGHRLSERLTTSPFLWFSHEHFSSLSLPCRLLDPLFGELILHRVPVPRGGGAKRPSGQAFEGQQRPMGHGARGFSPCARWSSDDKLGSFWKILSQEGDYHVRRERGRFSKRSQFQRSDNEHGRAAHLGRLRQMYKLLKRRGAAPWSGPQLVLTGRNDRAFRIWRRGQRCWIDWGRKRCDRISLIRRSDRSATGS